MNSLLQFISYAAASVLYLTKILLFVAVSSAAGLAKGVDAVSYIHDGHIHYDEDVWRDLPAEEAVKMLKDSGIRKALVSATPTEGAEMLYRENAEIVVPMLRPYKSWRHRYLWFNDAGLKDYLLEHLERVPYRGFGEFHVFGKNADSRPIEQMIRLAAEKGLALHPHTDLEGIKILLSKADGIPVLWAHGGFGVPVEILKTLLQAHPYLYIELSLREGMLNDEGELTSEWKSFLVEYRERFLVGMDTYKPGRWADLPEIVAETRHWLAQLPEDVARDISQANFDRIFDNNER